MANYNEALDEMENLNSVAAIGFKGVNLKVFHREFLKPYTKIDVIVNNLAQTFDG